MSGELPERAPETNPAARKPRIAILFHYFTGGNGGEFDTYRDPELYDEGAHSSLYKRANLARGVADVVEANLPHGSDTKILDIGAGTGILSLELAKRGCSSVTAFDLFPQPLAKLEEKAAKAGRAEQLTTVQGNMNNGLPFEDDAFGSVVSLRVTRYINNFGGWLRETRRVLEPGGSFVLPVFAVDTLPWKRHSDQGIFQPTTLRRVMGAVVEAGFEIDDEASRKYTEAVDLSLGERDVPFYYKPAFVVAENPRL